MKAIVYHQYGPPEVVTLAEIPKPVPKANEVLVRIYATTVSSGDGRARSLHLPAGFGIMARPALGFFGPRQPILGAELAGVVEAVGNAVYRFKIGDEVFAFTGTKMGCHAEYRTLAENGLIALKPSNLSFEEAASLSFGGTTALCFLSGRGGIKPGDNVLIVGASGSVGSAAVQIARHFDATVTGVCSAANAELVRSLGADEVIDYAAVDFATTGETYDIILDTTGTTPLQRVEASLRPGGRLLVVLGTFAQAIGLERAAKGSGKMVIAGVAVVRGDDLRALAGLAETGEFLPVIDRSYPLENAAEAHAYVDRGRKRGNVVLTVGRPTESHAIQNGRTTRVVNGATRSAPDMTTSV
jgi:NADPH:quinone reductase-like Zn-dependent oxidoreductase